MTVSPSVGGRRRTGTDTPSDSDASVIERSWTVPDAFAALFDRYADDIRVSYPKAAFTFLFDRATYDYLGLRTKGSVPKRVHHKWVSTDWYYEMRALQKVAVVDRIGQRP